MRSVSWTAAAAVVLVACASEQKLRDEPPQGPLPTSDDGNGSTVGQAFVASFPDLLGADGRVLLVTAPTEARVTVTQRANASGWAIDHSATHRAPMGTTRIELQPTEWSSLDPPSGVDVDAWRRDGVGLLITSDAPVEVRALWDTAYQQDLFLDGDRAMTTLLPVEELGTSYRVVVPQPADEPAHDFYFHVVATQDGTAIDLEDSVESVLLDAGDLHRVAITPDDVSADRTWALESSKPVAVFTGGGSPCDAGFYRSSWEQLPPLTRWGTEYVVPPLIAGEGTDLVVVADVDTLVQLDCGEPWFVTAGTVHRRPLTAPVRVTSDQPVMVLTEVRQLECGSNAAIALAAITPRALQRTDALLAPLHLKILSLFLDLGARHYTGGITVSPRGVALDPLASITLMDQPAARGWSPSCLRIPPSCRPKQSTECSTA